MDSSTRSMTATTGRTVLAIVAILSLLLSAFAIARPVIAAHDVAGPEVPAQDVGPNDPTWGSNSGGNVPCPAGTTEFTWNVSGDGVYTDTKTLSDGSEATATVTVSGNTLDFSVSGGLAQQVNVKASNGAKVYDYSGGAFSGDFPGPGIAHDDGLVSPTADSVSNMQVCVIPVDASIIVYKTDQTQADVAGAGFTVYDGDTAVAGPTSTNADGVVCFDELVLEKQYSVVETTVPDGYIGADSQTVAASLGTCEERLADGDGADATFSNTLLGAIVIYKTDQTGADVAGATFTVEGKEGTFTTEADGTFCVDGLAVNDTVTVTETAAPAGYELADPASQEVTVTQAGDCEDHDGTADATFTNNLLGSLLVFKTDDSDEALQGAKFSITGPDDFAQNATSDENGWFCIDGLTFGAEYTVTETDAPDGYQMDANNPQMHVIDDAATCEERVADTPTADLVFVNAEDEVLGSITIDKQLEECETCEAYTPGYWFNRGGGGGVDWADEWLGANPQTIAGVGTFDSVASVQAYLDADRAGDDGQNGLSATGQLLRHYLALVLNVAFAEANDCDLASLTYGEGTIAEWLDAALAALESDASDEDKRDIKDALDAINNSDAGDGTLECGDSEAGPHAGVMFELYDAEDQLVDSGTTGADGSLVLDGDPDGTGLSLGTYTLVEVSNDADLECSIVSVTGDGATLNEDGSVTIVLTEESADVTITVVNDCEEQQGEEDEFGHISVIKETDEAEPAESFGFTATWDADGFTLMDGDLEPSGELLAGVDYTVTEVLTDEQIAAGWSLDSIECTGAATWSVSEDGTGVTITLGADEDVVCTFTNELEDQPEGELEIIKIFCSFPGEDDILVLGPAVEEPLESARIMGADEELPLEDGCTLGAPDEETEGATFLITGADDFELEVTTTWSAISTVGLAPGTYTITELGTELSAEVTIVDDGDTAVIVWNYEEEQQEEDQGRIKILKLACTGPEGVTFTVVPGDVSSAALPTGASDCAAADATFVLDDGTDQSDPFTVGSDGIRLIPVDVGTYTLIETDPFDGESGDVVVTEGETTTVIVWNLTEEDEGEGEQPGGGGVTPGQSQTPREGTAGGNPLPNTATTPAPGGSLPAILLALTALGALAVGGQRMAAEARRRR